MRNFLHNLASLLRHCVSKHYPITPAGLAEAKNLAYMEGYAYWRKYKADICEYCFDGLIIHPIKHQENAK